MVGAQGQLGGTPTLPILGGNPKDDSPCGQLKKINENTNIKGKLNELKSNIGGTLEKGFLIRDIAGNETSDILIGNSDNTISYPILNPSYSAYVNQTYGSAHNHNKNNKKQIGIFTPEDLLPLYLCGLVETEPSNPYHTATPKKSVTFVLTEKGYFALKINDLVKLKAFVDWYIFTMNDTGRDLFNKKTFLDPEKYNILPKSSYAQQVTGFLRFMKDYDIGIELYEGNKDTYGDWKKLELIDNGDDTYNFNQIPCNP